MIKRNAGIDLLRCILVYGIVVYHAFFMGGFASGYESRLWTWCVPGFAFISGYYGVRLRVSKVIRLWVMASLCFMLPVCLGGRFIDLLSLNWYLHAYTILLLMSPILNAGLDRLLGARPALCLICALALGTWSWLSEFACTRDFIPKPNGLGALSFVSVLVMYVIGRAYRCLPEMSSYVRIWWGILAVPFFPLIGHYTSPATIAFVLAMFKAFERLDFGERVSRLLSILASSGFAVYVLHANWQVLPYLHDMSRHLILNCGIPRWFGLMFSAVIVWAGCVGLFLASKFALSPFTGVYDRLLKWLDRKTEGLVK